MLKKWYQAVEVYFDKRMLVMFFLGISSGFPLALVTSTLSFWLAKSDVSKKAIGVFALVKTPYSFKWLWSPVIDRVKLPFLSRLGRRRSWAVLTQTLLLMALLGMSKSDPLSSLYFMAICAVLVVIASASQDIVLDAYRIESFETNEQAAGTAIFVLGYRIGMLFSGAGALFLASKIGWNAVYAVMSLGAVIGLVTILCVKEPKAKDIEVKYEGSTSERFKQFLSVAVIAPFKDFMKRDSWKIILLFVFLFRMSDAYMGPMAYPFYAAMGFSEEEIAISRIYGLAATIFGGILGGILANRYSLMRALLMAGILQSVSNLMYVAQYYVGHDPYFLALTISIENITSGIGAACFVAYLASLCNTAYTATQYAILSSFMSLLRDVVSSTSGVLADYVSWPLFFMITTIIGIPGLLLIPYLEKKQKKHLTK